MVYSAYRNCHSISWPVLLYWPVLKLKKKKEWYIIMNNPLIIFPHLGIKIPDFSNSFTVFGVRIAYYGVFIAIAVLLAVILSIHRAKKTGQKPSDYYDLAIICVISAIIGARLYYITFRLDYFIANPAEIINIRGGGLAIYGGIIGGFLAGYFVCRYKKISYLQALDTVAPTIALGQAIGRWGNFVNLEAYGDYTDSLFAMQIRYNAASGIVTENIRNHLVSINGNDYIQVHPTFLYESVWCLLIFIFILIFRNKAQYHGEVLLWYLGAYGLERAFVEGLRTDQLTIGNSGIAVSQVLSVVLFLASFIILLLKRIRIIKQKKYKIS